MNPVHLGDSAYVRYDPATDEIILYTDNGMGAAEQEIFLDRRGALNLHEAIAVLLLDNPRGTR